MGIVLEKCPYCGRSDGDKCLHYPGACIASGTKKSAEELAKEYGIEVTPTDQESAEVQLLSGKRVAPDEVVADN